MSWGEVKKINSDFANEPLNFNNYINSIETFKSASYVLDPENSGLWRALISQSLTLFGHTAIHDVVYDRFTDADVDYMIRHNGRLGQSFNSFYHISDFTSGAIDDVIKVMTSDAYTKLELKLQNGINRYISDMTSGDTAGEWLSTIFGIDALKSKTTMASILGDTELWNNTIVSNDSLRLSICISAAAINWFSSNNSDAFLSFITEVANSTEASMSLIKALTSTSKLSTFFSNESVCSILTANSNSMKAICYDIDAFDAFLNSNTARNAFTRSEVAQTIMQESLVLAANANVSLGVVKTHMDGISEVIPDLSVSSDLIKDIESATNGVESCMSKLKTVTENVGDLILNMEKVFEYPELVKLLFVNSDAFVAVVNDTRLRGIAETAISNHISEYEVVSGSGANYVGKNACITQVISSGAGSTKTIVTHPEESIGYCNADGGGVKPPWTGYKLLYDLHVHYVNYPTDASWHTLKLIVFGTYSA